MIKIYFGNLVLEKKLLAEASVDSVQRCLKIAERIKKFRSNCSVLDVGSGEGLLANILDNEYKITFLDLNLNSLKKISKKNMGAVQGHMIRLPFRNNSFDIVTSIAALEHIQKKDRKKCIDELKRVTKSKLLVYVPVKELAWNYDKILLNFRKKRGISIEWVEEHVSNELPEINFLKKNFPNSRFSFHQNVFIWLFLMILRSYPFGVNSYKKIYFYFLRWFDFLPPHYSCIIEFNKKKDANG